MLVKFRAECRTDVNRLLDLIADSDIVGKFIEPTFKKTEVKTPDVEVTLALTNYSLEELRDKMKCVIDSHIMLRTLALIENYTGKPVKENADDYILRVPENKYIWSKDEESF